MKEIFSYIVLGIIGLFLLWYVFSLLTGQKYKKRLFGTRRITLYSSDVPVGGNVFGAYYCLREGQRFGVFKRQLDQRLIASFFMKWILEGKATVHSTGGVLRSASVELHLDMGFDDRTEMALFEMALAASGRDYVLTTGEFSRWVRNNYRIIDNWTDRARNRGRRYLISRGLMDETNHGTEAGFARLCGVIEFKEFLKSPSRGLDRKVPQPQKWMGYLVLSGLYGYAGRMADVLRRTYPSDFSQFSAQQAQLSGSLDMALSVSNSLSQAYGRAVKREEEYRERRNR